MALLRAIVPGNDVDLLVPLQSADQAKDAHELESITGCRVTACLVPNRRSPWHRAWYKLLYLVSGAAGGHSPRALYATPPDLLRAAARLSKEGGYDLAVFEYWYMYRVFPQVRARRKILLAHDFEFEVNSRSRGGSGRRRWKDVEARRELEACRCVDEVWTLTPEDAAGLSTASGLPGDLFKVFPFGVDIDALSTPVRSGGENVLFFGSFLADFNIDALDFLLEEVWPRLSRLRPEARMTVAGAGLSPARVRRIEKAGILCRGRVDDVADLYASASVVLIPLRYGGGLRIRLLEAMSCSRAVVATSIGAGSIGTPGVDLLVADDPDGLASAVAGLLADPESARVLGNAARTLVEARYSEAKAADGIRALIAAAPPDGSVP